jgi:hypothetical protein
VFHRERDGPDEEDLPHVVEPSFGHLQAMCRSFICTSLDQWFLNARTHVDR